MTTPARVVHEQLTHVMRFDFAFNQPGPNRTQTTAAIAAGLLNAGIQIGTLPKGAIVKTVDAWVDVAFNNGTANLFSVGLTPTGTDYVNGGSLAAQALVSTPGPIAAAATTKAATNDVPVYLSTSQTGTAATTGQCSVIITYHPALG